MSLRINAVSPDFVANTTQGPIRFHEWIGDSWAILFSHPKDFTPVCTTELGYVARLMPDFTKRGTKVIGLSIDKVSDHDSWSDDIEATQGQAVNYPMIGDSDLTVATLYNMLPEDADVTVRSVFIIGPDKRIKAMLVYPLATGRNFDEVLRLLDSIQLTAKYSVVTPVNWQPGGDVIIPPTVSDDAAHAMFPNGWTTINPYLRMVAQPND